MEGDNLVLVVGTYSVTGAAADDYKALKAERRSQYQLSAPS